MFSEKHIFPDEGFRKNGYTEKNGYIMVWKPSHPNCWKNGYVKLHRLVMEVVLGRFLRDDEHIHHIDENKKNNSPNNLMITNMKEHRAIHNILDQKGVLHFDINEVKNLYLQGNSARDVAKILGIGKSTVAKYIKELGISRPQMSKRNKYGKFIKEGNI